MSNLVGIVSKPQFDTDIFVVGKAIRFKHFATSNGYKLLDKHGLIMRNSKLEIEVTYYDTGTYDTSNIVIPIEKVISQEFELKILEG